VNNGKRKFIRA